MSTATFDTHAAVRALTRAGVATEQAEVIADTGRVAVSEGADTVARRRRPRRAGRPGGRAPSGGRGCGGEFHRPAPDRGNRVRPGLQAAPRRAIVAA